MRMLMMLCLACLLARSASAQTVTDYYPPIGGFGSTVTVHVSDMRRMVAPRGPEALRLFINGQQLPDSAPTVEAPSGRVQFTLPTTDATRQLLAGLGNRERVVLSVGWEAPLPVNTDREGNERRYVFETHQAVTDFYPQAAGIGSVVTVHVSALDTVKARDTMQLFLGGERIADSRPFSIDVRNRRVKFRLASSEASRPIWQRVTGWSPVPLSVGWNDRGELPVTPPEGATEPRLFRVVSPVRAAAFLVMATAIGLAFVLAGVGTNLLRTRALSGSASGERPYAFSLGRTQMAWWTFIAVLSSLFVWTLTTRFIVTGDLIVLMGISAATAVGAVVVDAAKQAGAAAHAARVAADVAKAETAAAAVESTILQQSSAANGAALSTSAAPLRMAVAVQADRLASLARAATPPASTGGFLRDILSDENGISFHRFQMATWTVVLGVYFVFEVVVTREMPELSPQLLALMGISGSTYLGFKFPERRS